MDLLYFLKVLYRKKWTIIALTLLAIITAFFFLVNKSPLYTSLAQYSTGFTSERVKLVDGSSAIDLFTVDVKFDNVIETIKSPQVLSRISYSLLLHDLTNSSSAFKTLSEKDKQNDAYKAVNRDSIRILLTDKLAQNQLLKSNVKNEYEALEYLKLYGFDYNTLLGNLTVSRVARTDYLDIFFNSENPNLSASVVNSIGNEFLNYYRSLNLRRTNESAQSIKDLVQSQQNKVDSLGKQLLNEKISQGTIDPVSRTTSAMETVTGLETRLAEEKSKFNEHSNRYNYLKTRLGELEASMSGGGGNDEIVKLTNRRNELTEELNRKGGSDPVLEKQISDLRAQINAKANSGSGKAKTKDAIDAIKVQISEESAMLNASRSSVADYEASIRRYMGMTNTNPGSGIKMDVIQTQLAMENKQLGNVKEMYNQVQGLAKDDPTSNFIQTRIGQPASEPNSKKTMVKMALSGASVFFLSAIFFIFLEIFDSSVKTPGIFSKLSKVKIANVVNQVNLKKSNPSAIMLEDTLVNKFRKNDVFKNNIRKLRYELLHSDKKIFLFTSTQNKTGKSTVIEALATSLTLSKKKVLILDMNFTNNTLTRAFGTEVFIQDVAQNINLSAPFAQQNIAGKTQFEGLDIIGCREGNTTPSESLYNIDIKSLFEYLKESYDFLLVEGPSLNNFADSKELAQYVEGVFTVFSADLSMLQVDMESMRFIADLKGKNHGVILNKVLTENINS